MSPGKKEHAGAQASPAPRRPEEKEKSVPQEGEPPKEAIKKLVIDAVQGRAIKDETYDKIEVRHIVKNSVLAVVVVVPKTVLLGVKRNLADLAAKIEEATGGTAFVIRRRVSSGLEKGVRRYRTGQTYKDYQEDVARDLVAPSHVVDRRTLVRADGTRLEKILVDAKSKKEVAHRFEPMSVVFGELFGMQSSFQANYY